MMTPRTVLSEASKRTSPPVISALMQTALTNPDLISLAAGFVDQASLPVDATARAIEAMLQDPVEARRALQYGTTIGDHDLRSEIIAQLERNEGVPAGEFRSALPRTIITTGSAQLLYLITETLLDPGDIVLVEAPTYFVFLGTLETRGARVIGVETDSQGLRIDALEATLARLDEEGALDRVKLIYTVTEHANPTGNSLAETRRGALVDAARRWSKNHRIFVVEDAAYRGLTYLGPETPSVWRHDDAADTVILARTFSKTLSPGLRVGYGILPEPLVAPLLRLKGNHDFGSAHFSQQLLARLLADGTYEKHVVMLRDLYRRKRDIMLDALDEFMEPLDGVRWTKPSGGLFVWLTVPEGLDTGPDGPLFAKCLEEGVIYVPGVFAFAGEPGPTPMNHARICFGVPQEDDLREGIRRLAAALTACLEPVA